MNGLKNLSVSGKFISVVVILLILEAVIGISSIYFLNRMNNNLNAIVEVDAEKIKLANRINRNLVEIHRAEKNMLLSNTKEAIELYANKISTYKNELENWASDLIQLLDLDNKALLDQFFAVYQEFIKINAVIESMVFHESGLLSTPEAKPSTDAIVSNTSEAIALSQGKGRQAFNVASDVVSKLVEKIDADMDKSKILSAQKFKTALIEIILLTVISIIIGLTLGFLVSRSIAGGLNKMVVVADAIARGELETPIDITGTDEIGKLSSSVLKMQTSLKKSRDDSSDQNWLKTGLVRLNEVMVGETDLAGLGNNVICEIATYLDAKVGAFYLTENMNSDSVLTLQGSYAYMKRKNLSNTFKFGEGLVGQSAREKKPILVSNVPEDHIKVVTGLGESTPRSIFVTPFLYENRVTGVIEIGFLDPPTDLHLAYLDQAMAAIAINFVTVQGREDLTQSQTLAEELETQQEELRTLNEELEEQTQALESSEQKLKVQQEELEVSNEELIEKNQSLEQQKKEIEKTRKAMEQKAEELAIAGKYKSEFLANMSHELRTPLNSLLLLSSILSENKEGNLTPDQLESTQVIYQSGNDLLSLINEILDLAKIESGRMDLQSRNIVTRDIADSIVTNFQHMAEAKKLNLAVHMADTAPVTIYSDKKPVDQILKNLMSNAIKFTEKGTITVDFGLPPDNADLSRSGLDRINTLAIAVKDTGIGISPESQKIVFEAFQQVEGGTARQYGGTGLGLSISRELARLLGGEIQLTSEKGKGSVFTLYLPVTYEAVALPMSAQDVDDRPAQPDDPIKRTQQQVAASESILDDRETLGKNEKTILVVEDDPKFARLLLKLCHERGLKCLATPLGEEGLILAEKYMPEAIILDIKLPGMDGWAVLENLKENPKIRHIPVHIMSVEEPTMEAFRKGAVGYLKKPINKEELDEAFHKLTDVFSKEVKNLLVVEDDENLRKSIIKLIGNGDVHAEQAATGTDAIQILKSKVFDCMILDLGLPDMTGFELLKALEAEEGFTMPPVIVYTGRDLSRKEDEQLHKYAESIIIKGVKSEERLLDEASLFLHRIVSKLPEKKRQMITSLHDTDASFKDKTVLVVDDDMRNVYALCQLLEGKGMNVLKAENGQKALDVLKTAPVVDLVLMDIMMPIMDGYETMKRIRAQEIFRKLPIIVLTAKAMKEDKARCIAAGASDYLAKPVDGTRLSSMMRVWLYR